MMTTLDVVIVNWNAGDRLRRTVEAVGRSSREAFELGSVVVVDNASTDGSADGIATFREVSVLRNDVNRGFAAACNQGAAAGDGDFLLFLNPDTEVDPQALDDCVRALERQPRVGALGAQLVDRDGTPQLSCSRFPTPGRFVWKAMGLDRVAPSIFKPHYMTDFDHDSSRIVDQVMGAFLMTRRDLFEDLDGFDERFFVYFEEVDYCYRLSMKGYVTYFLSSARVFHSGGGTTEHVQDRRLYYNLMSRLLYGFKHFGTVGAVVQTAGTFSVELIARLLLAAAQGSPGATLRGYAMLARALPGVLTSNGTVQSAHRTQESAEE